MKSNRTDSPAELDRRYKNVPISRDVLNHQIERRKQHEKDILAM